MKARWLTSLAVLSSLAAIGTTAVPAGATFPGTNGRIVYYDFFESPRQIYTVDPDGTDVLQLTSGTRSKIDPAWSADGTMIAFASSGRAAPRGRLETMDADGGGRTLVVGFANHDVLDPAWSDNGSQIAFCRIGRRGPRIWVVGTDGSGLTRLTPSDENECGPDWSPDGSKIAFVPSEGGLWVMDADGSNRVAVVERGSISAPSWSPDGTRLAYTKGTLPSGRTDVFVVNANGTGRTRLTSTGTRWELTPAWAPDGTSIAFCRVPGRDALAPCELWTMDADGSNPTRITTTPDVDEFALSWQAV